MKLDKEDTIFYFLEEVEQPFTLEDFFKATGLNRTKRIETDIINTIHATDYFVLSGGLFYPKSTFLKDFLIRMQPTAFEIKEGILIQGHRMLPFHPPGMFSNDITFLYNDSPVKTRLMKFKMEEIMIYFTLMDFQKFPIINVEDLLEENADLEIEVCDLKTFYKKNKFKLGDTIIAESIDFNEGIFSIHYDSAESYRDRIFEIKRMDKKFLNTLKKKVLPEDMVFPNVEKQLLCAYFHLSREMEDEPWTIPGTAVGPLLQDDDEIVFSAMPNGRTILHFAHQDAADIKAYPDFNDFVNMALAETEEEEEPGLDSIDGILKFLDNNNDSVVVRALLLDQITDQITDQKKFNYKAVEDYLFAGLPKPYMPQELRDDFKQMVSAEYHKIKKSFDPNYAFLPVTTTRKKILEASLVISTFLRALDGQRVMLEDLPKDDMMHLMELDRSLAEVLFTIEAAQMEGENSSADVRRVLKMVDRVIPELPRIFALIQEKIKRKQKR